jgi:hypothetical protein
MATTATATPSVSKADYDARLKEITAEQKLDAAQQSLDSYNKTVNEGVEVLKALRAVHLAHPNAYGSDTVRQAIRSLSDELNYQERYRKSAQDVVDSLKGEKPAPSDREF